MGIPKFYRWIKQRYPAIEEVNFTTPPEYDNLYLDVNGLIHNAAHANNPAVLGKTFADVYFETCCAIDRIVKLIKPKKLVYLAVDGVAPLAKMNHQRSRRFRAIFERAQSRDREQKGMFKGRDQVPTTSAASGGGAPAMVGGEDQAGANLGGTPGVGPGFVSDSIEGIAAMPFEDSNEITPGTPFLFGWDAHFQRSSAGTVRRSLEVYNERG